MLKDMQYNDIMHLAANEFGPLFALVERLTYLWVDRGGVDGVGYTQRW